MHLHQIDREDVFSPAVFSLFDGLRAVYLVKHLYSRTCRQVVTFPSPPLPFWRAFSRWNWVSVSIRSQFLPSLVPEENLSG